MKYQMIDTPDQLQCDVCHAPCDDWHYITDGGDVLCIDCHEFWDRYHTLKAESETLLDLIRKQKGY